MPKLNKHPDYLRVVEAANQSFENSRSITGLSDELILLARLYAYGFRGQIIGTFHATRVALETQPVAGDLHAVVQKILRHLATLSDLSLEGVPTDFRAILTTFRRYDQALAQTLVSLEEIGEKSAAKDILRITDRFVQAVQRVTGCSGIVVARDDETPEQASFIVPSLGIEIVPLVYGDQHSWNMAVLSGQHRDVPRHLHQDGIEIHLGFGSLQGQTCLAGGRADVSAGYAMPIAPGTPHGYLNTSGHDHFLPFIFGSRRLGGWGIFPDVMPQPIEPEELKVVDILSREMNGTVLLDQEIEKAANSTGTWRRALISHEQTYSPRSGGLSLSLSRIESEGLAYPAERYQIVRIVRGRGTVTIGSSRQEISSHDHFGIPSGATAFLQPQGEEPFVALDAVLIEEPPANLSSR